jgi:hypothetical protein
MQQAINLEYPHLSTLVNRFNLFFLNKYSTKKQISQKLTAIAPFFPI